MKLLCLSNGHGEDIIAVRILQALQAQDNPPEIAALPIVGEGHAYTACQIPLAGPVKRMPSGGFIYMDGRQLARDVQGGLVQLTLAQLRTVKAWAKEGGVVLAVGDIVPLLFAWLSGAPYAFVGTAKSEYYLRDEAGWLPRRSWFEKMEGWAGSVYLPWERWLMSRDRARAVFPRDSLTTDSLQQWKIPAFDLGNPMMDGLAPTGRSRYYETEAEAAVAPLIVTLIPGSRPPEAYNNWQLILQAVAGLTERFSRRSLRFLGAIAPGLELEPLRAMLADQGWQSVTDGSLANPLPDPDTQVFRQGKTALFLSQKSFNDCLHQADFAIAMAGTATEQFVGLGKPALTLAGGGPQFTPAFAEAQTRLLGCSVILAAEPSKVITTLEALLQDPDRLQIIAENGRRRMGTPGAAERIAACLRDRLLS